MDSIIQDSFEPSQPSQTQPMSQTQRSTQPASRSNGFPDELWGLLIGWSPSASEFNLLEPSDQERLARPARIELRWAQKMFTVGRSPRCELRLTGKKISTQHATIYWDDQSESVKLKDTSTNGTIVRGRRLQKGEVTELLPGDSIIFGPPSDNFQDDFRYTFQCRNPVAEHERLFVESDGGGIADEYEVLEKIGKGSFATVRRAVQRRTGTTVAVKIVNKARFANNPKTMEMIRREIDIMRQIDHKFCVKYIDYFEDHSRMWLVIEYVDGGDLLDYVMSRDGLAEEATREIGLMVCQAVAYLHSRKVAHRDLKPENLMMTKGAHPLCKVTDFGLAKMVQDGSKLQTACGTPTYLAPEVILNPNQASGYSDKVDAWSIGIILFSCMANATPFDESEATPLPQRMRERVVDLVLLEERGVSEVGVDFVSKLLQTDPKKRMSVADALKHPWLAINDGVCADSGSSSLPFNDNEPGGSQLRASQQQKAAPLAPIDEAISVATSAGVSSSGRESFEYSQKLQQMHISSPEKRPTNGASSPTNAAADTTLDEDDEAPQSPTRADFPSSAPVDLPSSANTGSLPPLRSKFSSASTLGRPGSAMSLDHLDSSPAELRATASRAFDLPPLTEESAIDGSEFSMSNVPVEFGVGLVDSQPKEEASPPLRLPTDSPLAPPELPTASPVAGDKRPASAMMVDEEEAEKPTTPPPAASKATPAKGGRAKRASTASATKSARAPRAKTTPSRSTPRTKAGASAAAVRVGGPSTTGTPATDYTASLAGSPSTTSEVATPVGMTTRRRAKLAKLDV